ncbi:MAG TPA: PHP domain-containing protein, partial [Streptomyces sp.]|nr:PHP domain-containing protein [Streptomyces sp.]
MPGFVHLHVASGFSLRYGASHPETLAERAAERGMDAVALTDRDTLAGAVRFAKASANAGVRPVYGADLAVAERPEEKSAVRRRRTPVRGGAFIDESAQRVVFLAAQGALGWDRLCRLVSAAHAGGSERPQLEWGDLAALGGAYEGALNVLLGPASDVGRALAAGRPDRAARLLGGWREIFGTALRLEVTGDVPLRESARMLGLAAEQGVKPVLTNAVRYADPSQGPVADVLDAARRLVPVDPRKGLDSGERWLKGPEAMEAVALCVAEAAGYRRDTAHRLLALTEETAGDCRVDPEDDIGIGRVHFPEPWLVGAGAAGGHSRRGGRPRSPGGGTGPRGSGGRTAERVLRSR